MRRFATLALAVLLAACSHAPEKTQSLTEKAYYDAAQKSLKYGNFETATKHLEALESHYPVGAYTEQAQLELIYARLKHSDFAGALSASDRFIRLHPQHAQLDYVYYLKGLAHFQAGHDTLLSAFGQDEDHRDQSNARKAFDQFQTLLTRFPDSPYAPDARQRLIDLRNSFAEGEMHAARFYLKRGAWVSVLNRCRWVIENYPQTPQIPEALAMSAFSYNKLKMTDLASSTLAVLQKNYPEYIDSRGRPKVDLGPQNENRSWLNMATWGLVGKRHTQAEETPPPPPTP
jgi:outer membrane protein assembly factor BamD